MIRGFFDPAEPDRQLARVRVRVGIVRVPNSPEIIWGEVPFVIDTGSETTCLHPDEGMVRLGIAPDVLRSPVGWNAQSERVGIGGSATYFLVNCLYVFRQEDGTSLEHEGILEVAQLTDLNQRVPSVLGWDVLQHFAMRFDWSQPRGACLTPC